MTRTLIRMWPFAVRRKKKRNAERQKRKPLKRRRRGSEKRCESDERWNLWAATGNGNGNGKDCTNAKVGETTGAVGIEAMTIGIDGGVSASLHHSKTDLGWKTGNATVGQRVLPLDVPDPWTENIAV